MLLLKIAFFKGGSDDFFSYLMYHWHAALNLLYSAGHGGLPSPPLVIPAHGRLRQEELEFKASLYYIAISKTNQTNQ
jgi:hypothetical protein